MGIINKIKHLLRLNKGRPEARWVRDKLLMGFHCNCGEIHGEFEVKNP